MNISNKIQVLRRIITKSLTRHFGKSEQNFILDEDISTDIKKVLISRPNHRLGNQLLIIPLVQEVINTFHNCKIDLLLQGNLGPIIFKNYPQIDQIIKLPRKPLKEFLKYIKVWISIKQKYYDLVINVVCESSSGRLSTKLSNAKFKIFGDVSELVKQQSDNFEHIAKSPIYVFRDFLLKIGHTKIQKSIPSINIKLTDLEIKKGKEILDNLVDSKKKTISIFTFATADKCYSESWWLPFYDKLKNEFPNYNILEILPVENISQINFKAPSFYSKDIREMASVIENTKVFIIADSGIMHLGCATNTPTIGLFSRANMMEYQPYGNKNTAINTNLIDKDGCIQIVKNILNNK